MPNILDLRVTADNVLEYWEADTNRAPYVGEIFFPNEKQVGLKIEILKGKQGLPVALVPANFNTNVLYRDRIGVTELSAKLPFFKEAYKVDEELRQHILTARDEYANSYLPRIFDDTNDLLDGAAVSVERMRMQVLSQGTISIQANGVDKQYDYGFESSTQFKTETTLWSNEAAKPFKSFMENVKAYKNLSTNKTHVAPKYALMNTAVFNKLAQDSDVLGYFAKLATPIAYPTDEEIKAYIEARAGLTIIINDKSYLNYRDFNGTPVPFYPQDRFTLLSKLDLGKTVYGTTPEEVDLMNGTSSAATVAVTAQGVAITTWKEVDPVNVNVKVSEVVAPSCPNIEDLFIVKVL